MDMVYFVGGLAAFVVVVGGIAYCIASKLDKKYNL